MIKNTIKDAGWLLGLNAAFVVLLVLFAVNRGLGDAMLSIVIPMLLITSAALFYTYRFSGDTVTAIASALLLETGQMTQVLINEETSAQSTVLLFVSPFLGVIGIIAIHLMQKIDYSDRIKSVRTLSILAGSILVIALGLLIFGRNINGTKAWLVVGGLSLQLTELFKPLYIVFHAVLWSAPFRHRTRFLLSAGITFGSAGLLLIINELGTLLVILCMWIILTFLYSDRILDTAISFGGTVLTILGGYAVMGLIYNSVKKTISMGEAPNGVMKKIFQIYDKLRQRVMIVTDLDQYLAEYKDEASRQPFKAREMIMKGGLFGTTRRTTIPIENSDYAYVGLILRCGIVFAVVVLVLFFIIFCRSMIRSVRISGKYESIVLTGAALGLILPTFINVMGTTNFSFMTGIAVPFISHGGTNMILSVFNVMLLLWGSCRTGPDIAGRIGAKFSGSRRKNPPVPNTIPFTR